MKKSDFVFKQKREKQQKETSTVNKNPKGCTHFHDEYCHDF